jgi:nicotinamidase-related amidase
VLVARVERSVGQFDLETRRKPMTDHASESLHPSNAALLLIDHQVGTMNFGISDIGALELKNNTMLLAEAARAFGLPVILTASNPNGPNGPVFPELVAALPGVPVIERLIINSWKDPRFVEAVKKTGRKKLIMAGVSSDVCLALPAVSAARDGYDVYAVLDASGTFSQHALMASMLRMSQAGVVICNATMLVSELLADWSSQYAEPIGEILSERVPNFGFVAAGFYHRAAK